MSKLLIVNQSANYLMVDTAKAFVMSGKYEKVVLLVGNPEGVKKAKDFGVEIDSFCPYVRKSIKTRFKSWTKGIWQIIRKVRNQYSDYDLFLVSNPPLVHLLPYFCKNRFSTLVYDIYPDGIVSGKFVTENNIIYKIWKKWANNFYNKVDRVFTISDGMAERLSQYVSRDKLDVVTLWANSNIKPVKKEDNIFIKQNNLEGKFVVLYSGNVGKGSNISVLVNLAKMCKDDDSIEFVIVGEGMEKELAQKMIKEYQLNNVKMLPFQSLEMLPHSLSSADIAYVSSEVNFATISVPSKTFNLINVGAPLLCIANSQSEISRMVKNNRIGEVFMPDELEKMKTYVYNMKDNPSWYKSMKANVYKAQDLCSPKNAEKFVKA